MHSLDFLQLSPNCLSQSFSRVESGRSHTPASAGTFTREQPLRHRLFRGLGIVYRSVQVSYTTHRSVNFCLLRVRSGLTYTSTVTSACLLGRDVKCCGDQVPLLQRSFFPFALSIREVIPQHGDTVLCPTSFYTMILASTEGLC